MRKHIFFLSFTLFLLLSITFTSAYNFFNTSEAVLNVTLKKEFYVYGNPNELKFYLSSFPKNSIRQKILRKFLFPQQYEEKENEIVFHLDPHQGKKEVYANYLIKTKKYKTLIRNKVRFPLETVSEISPNYLLPTKTVVVNDKVREKAFEIVGNDDDLFSVVSKIIFWTRNNIEYSLNEDTMNKVIPTDVVLSSGLGVCDEFSNVVLSFLRSMGIPSRAVAGYSYSNANGSGWRGHAWIEVYFPNYGWVPFDPTYGQYGFVDPSHIEMKYSQDFETPDIEIYGRGFNFKIDNNERSFDFDVNIISLENLEREELSFEANPLYNPISFGSYNVIEVSVKNNMPFYISDEISLTVPKELEILNNRTKLIILKPFEEKTLYFVVKVSANLDSNYIYTFPILISSNRGENIKTKFKSHSQAITIGKEAVQKYLEQDQKNLYEFKTISLNCSLLNTNKIYVNQTINVKCNVLSKEPFNSFIKLCLNKNNCQRKFLNKNLSIFFNHTFSDYGNNVLFFELFASNYYTNQIIPLTIYPIFTESDLNLILSNTNITSNDLLSFNITFNEQKLDYIKNFTLILTSDTLYDKFNSPSSDTISLNFIYSIPSLDLKPGQNKFNIGLYIEDKNNNTFTIEKTFIINVKPLNFKDSILMYSKYYVIKFFRFIQSFL